MSNQADQDKEITKELLIAMMQVDTYSVLTSSGKAETEANNVGEVFQILYSYVAEAENVRKEKESSKQTS